MIPYASRMLAAALGTDLFALKYGSRVFTNCWGCGKPARNGHCKKCQDKDPFAWLQSGPNSIRGRFRGQLFSLERSTSSRFGHEAVWSLRFEGKVLFTFAGHIDEAKKKTEKYLLDFEAECKSHATL